MFWSRFRAWILAVPLAGAALQSAHAVPAFAAQTQQPCEACHIGGFGPQLTPFGRQFKLNGYALRAGDAFTVPVSAGAIASFDSTAKDQAAPPAPHYSTNNNFTIDQVNLFLAGGFYDHFGAFSQWTYDGVGRGISWDNQDWRAVDQVTMFDMDVLLGLSFNNAPTVQDPWNSTPAWGYPYTSSALNPSPAAGPVIAGAFAGNVLGVTAYAWWDAHVLTEAGAYWTPGNSFLRTVGASPTVGTINGAAPYVRIAYQQDYGDQNFEVGGFALIPNVVPSGLAGPATDDYADFGVDASYQYMGDMTNIFSANLRYTREQQDLGASFAAGNAANLRNSLNDLRLDASWYWHNEVGVTVAPFATWGSSDALLYAGNRTFSPDSSGVNLQVDYTLFPNSDSPLGERFNVRVGVQYTAYTEFDGAASNFDRAGTNAGDNNTVRLFLWTLY